MPSDPTFGELLREHRRTARYSQEALAERAGLSPGAVAALEQSIRRAPHRNTVDALVKALSMSAPARRRFEDAAAQARRRQRRDDANLPETLTSFIERNEVTELQGVSLALIVSAESPRELDDLITSLPVWPQLETRVTPLTTFDDRRRSVAAKLARSGLALLLRA
ncbi:MAG TPA: helix-turn-helix domain-containing protein [Candidatus Tumulicola sp.]|jgi:transcriptional regulator with XRE-family HTH domain